MKDSVIKVGIIGLGAIGTRLLNQFYTNPATAVTAVCDVSSDRAKEVAEQFQIEAWYTDYKNLMNNEDINLVYVAVPPSLHYEVVQEAVRASKHILCEKPLANSVEEAKEMWDIVRESNLVNAMNFPLNYSSGPKTFHKMIREGYIGDLRKLELQLHFPQWPRAWQQNAWVASRSQGGFILEVGIHFIQLIQRVFGDITNIKSKIEWPSDPEKSEIGVVATMELEDGTPMLINGLSHIAGEERIALKAYGTEGTLSLVNWGIVEGGKIGQPISVIAPDEQLTSTLISNLVSRLQGDSDATIVDFEAGYKAQLVLEALRKG